MEMEKIDKGLNWFDRGLEIIDKYKFKTIFKAIIFLLIVAATVGFIKNPTWVFEQYDAWRDRQHDTAMISREEIDTKIHTIIDKLNFKTNSARVMILEYHNGTESASGMPFRKCSATYEAVNVGVMPIAYDYSEINLSLMPFANYMSTQGYWHGNIDEIEAIDRALCYRFKANGFDHFAAVTIEGIDKPLALLIVSFDGRYIEHDCAEVRENIRHCALELAVLFEINQQYAAIGKL